MIVEQIISSLIIGIAITYCIYKIGKSKIDFKDYKLYIIYFLGVSISVLTTLYMSNTTRAIIMVAYYSFSMFLLEKKIRSILIKTISVFFVVLTAELLFSLFLELVLSISIIQLQQEAVNVLIVDCFISLLIVGLTKLKSIKRIFKTIIDITQNFKARLTAIAVISIFVLIFVFQFSLYFKFSRELMFYIDIAFVIIYTIIILIAMREKGKKDKFQDENKYLYSNLNAYEKMLDSQRMANHENRNQLLVIKEMVISKDKNVLSYINEIIKDKRKNSITLLDKTKKIPAGGLQAIISQKILEMNDSNIKCLLDISKEIKVTSLLKLSIKENYDLSRIVGIFIDNAMDEVKSLKEKEIIISLYKQNGIVIEIINECVVVPQIEKIGKKRISTKGKNRGNGLLLVNKIINETEIFENNKSVNEHLFKQVLKIKI